MFVPLLALVLAAPFPLPSIDGKNVAVTEGQRTFKLPMRFEKLRAFYESQFAGIKEITVAVSGTAGTRELRLVNRRPGDSWTRAVVREGEVETTVEVTPVLRLQEEAITGNGKPLVEFVIGRSRDVDQAVKSIDHTEAIRR